MAASNKRVRKAVTPRGKIIPSNNDPDKFYTEHPSWRFSSCDNEMWSLLSLDSQKLFWEEIFPRLKDLETQKWSDILVDAKKQNHSIEIQKLNKIAVDRLSDLFIEIDSIVSIRLTGKHRIYGFITGSVFNILWVDLNHGDNSNCICRSKKRHT